MHVPDAPARRSRRTAPSPAANLRAGRLAARCDAGRRLAQLLDEELLTVHATFRVGPGREDAVALSARILAESLPRAVPPGAVAALADELAHTRSAGGSRTLTDVDVRLWFLAWSLEDHHAASRST